MNWSMVGIEDGGEEDRNSPCRSSGSGYASERDGPQRCSCSVARGGEGQSGFDVSLLSVVSLGATDERLKPSDT